MHIVGHPLVGTVDDMQLQVRLTGLLQGGLEGRHQIMGQMTDKPNRVV